MSQRRVRFLVASGLLASVTIIAQFPSGAVAAPPLVQPDIAGGDFYSLALDADGILWSFGENLYGQLGHAENIGTSTPNPVPTQVLSGVLAVAGGFNHSMALKSDGTVWTFGDNKSGQLGRSVNSGIDAANPVPAPVPGLTNVVAIDAGGFHSLALKGDGTVWAWGHNAEGALGTATNNDTELPNPTPTQVPGLTGISAIAAGDYHSMALKSDGTLWTFGWNLYGQLGDPLTSGDPGANPTPVQVLTGIDMIAAGGSHSLAVTTTDELKTFGLNFFGQLGTATNSGTSTDNPNPTTVIATQVAAVAAGLDHSLVLKTDGTLWTFGYNWDGELGTTTNNGTANPNPVPTQVLSGVDEIAAGGYHSLLFNDDRELITFGWNNRGQLGVTSNSGSDAPNPTPIEVPSAQFLSLVPGRLLDTRAGTTTVDGLFQGIGARAAGSTLELQVTGRGGVAPIASAVVLNVTVTGAQAGGFVTVYPCGSPLPNASSLNFAAGSTIPNLVISQVGAGGKVCIFTSAATHVIADVAGFYPVLPTFVALVPGRLLDSRVPASPTVDGTFQAIGLRAAGSTTELLVADRGGVAADAKAVALNVTVAGALGAGYVTVYPCGSPLPNASNINFVAGQTIPNLVIAKIGAGGKVCVFTSAPTHLIADVGGFYPATTSYESMVPGRLMDSRLPGSPTVDGLFSNMGVRAAGSITELPVGNRGGVAATAKTAVLNLTVTNAQATGYITVFPCGSPQPNSSNLNYIAGTTIANLVMTKIGSGGKVCIFTSAAANVIVDVSGHYAT